MSSGPLTPFTALEPKSLRDLPPLCCTVSMSGPPILHLMTLFIDLPFTLRYRRPCRVTIYVFPVLIFYLLLFSKVFIFFFLCYLFCVLIFHFICDLTLPHRTIFVLATSILIKGQPVPPPHELDSRADPMDHHHLLGPADLWSLFFLNRLGLFRVIRNRWIVHLPFDPHRG